MASDGWAKLMRYVTRRIRARVRGDVSDLAADVQLELARFLAAGNEVRSLYRLADCAIRKQVDRHERRPDRRVRLVDAAVTADPAGVAPTGSERLEGKGRSRIEKMPAWRLLRGRLERAIVRGVWDGHTLADISKKIRCSPKEARRVALGLPEKIARRRAAR